MQPPTPPEIRDASEHDAAAIAEIYNQSVAVGDATMDDEEWSAESVSARIRTFGPRQMFLVAVDEGQVAGWGIIKKYSDRSGYRFCCETAVYLRRDQTGRGHGTRLKLALIERCRQLHYRHMVAKIFAENRGSIEYNLKLGYEMVGIQKQIGYKNGRWVDVAILQLVLDDVTPEIPSELMES